MIRSVTKSTLFQDLKCTAVAAQADIRLCALKNMDQKITALKVQKRNPNRVNIYLDGEFAFGLSKIVAAWLQIGQVITEAKIASLKEQDTYEVALQKALHYLSYRPRSETEVTQKLTAQGFEEAIIQKVMDRLRSVELVKDEAFASLWVENRNTFRPRGRRALALELRQKGIEEGIIQATLLESVDDDQLAYQAACRYVNRLQGLDRMKFRERLSGFLGRRGFSYETIRSVVNQIWSEQQESKVEPDD